MLHLRSFFTSLILFCTLGLVGFLGPKVFAKTFKNSYLSFELPDTWGCEREDTEYICTPLDGTQSRNAMIILSAKEAGPSDNLEAYQGYLAQAKLLESTKGPPQPSKMVHTMRRNIHGQQWVEGLHFNSEIEGFFTLYLATVKNGLAVLVSLSAEKEIAAKYNDVFSKIVKSIRLTASNELLSAINDRQMESQNNPIGIPADINIGDAEAPEDGLLGKVPKEAIWGVLALVFFFVLFLAITTFKPKKKKRSRTRR